MADETGSDFGGEAPGNENVAPSGAPETKSALKPELSADGYLANWDVLKEGPMPVVKQTDMKGDMVAHACLTAARAIVKAKAERKTDSSLHGDTAEILKKEFDAKFQPIWHCVVGKSFESWVVHETRCFIFFYIGPVAILLFKAGGAARIEA